MEETSNQTIEREFAERALNRLRAKTGFEVTVEAKEPLVGPNLRADFLLRIDAGKFQVPFVVEIKRSLRSIHQIEMFLNVRGSLAAPLLVIAETISPAIRTELRNLKVGYMDFGGNLFLPVELFSQVPTAARNQNDGEQMKRRTLSMTSDSIVKLGLMLISDPSGADRPQRMIANELQLSLGAVNNAIHALLTRGLIIQIPGGGIRLRAPHDFIQWWASAYNEGLRRTQELGSFERIPNDPNWWKGVKVEEIAWGGESAAAQLTNYLTPEMLTIYLYDDSPEIRRQLRLVPSENGNVLLYRAFWPRSFSRAHEGLAPIPVIYADLLASGVDRNIETANMVKGTFLEEYERAHARK